MKEIDEMLNQWIHSSIIRAKLRELIIKENKTIDMKENELHQIARDIMEKLNEKYNITNELSLDEYLDEFRGMLIEDEIDEIIECLRQFDKIK